MENPFEILLDRLDQVGQQLREIKEALDSQGIKKEGFINVDQAAEYLNVKKSTLYTHTRNKTIMHYKVSGNLYFLRSDLDDYIKRGAVMPKKTKY